MRRLPLIAALAACIGVTAVTVAWCADTTHREETAFGKKVRAYLLAHPEVIEEAIQALQTKRDAETASLARKAISQHVAELTQRAGDPTLGDGPVTVVEFFDYRCSYCKAAAPHIPEMVSGHKAIRLVFKDYPILSQISDTAARAALAAARQGKYVPVHLALMAEKSLDEAAIDRILTEKGVNLDQAHKDMKSPEVEKQLDDNRTLAKAIGVDGTPSFVIGQKMIGGFLEDGILAAVKADGAHPAAAKAAGQ
jgi:protein-disulfide isomerase